MPIESTQPNLRDTLLLPRFIPVASAPMAPAARNRSAAEEQLRLALRVSFLSHTYSFAQVIGIYPA